MLGRFSVDFVSVRQGDTRRHYGIDLPVADVCAVTLDELLSDI